MLIENTDREVQLNPQTRLAHLANHLTVGCGKYTKKGVTATNTQNEPTSSRTGVFRWEAELRSPNLKRCYLEKGTNEPGVKSGGIQQTKRNGSSNMRLGMTCLGVRPDNWRADDKGESYQRLNDTDVVPLDPGKWGVLMQVEAVFGSNSTTFEEEKRSGGAKKQNEKCRWVSRKRQEGMDILQRVGSNPATHANTDFDDSRSKVLAERLEHSNRTPDYSRYVYSGFLGGTQK
ncbi:hypothetical protein B0H11DRAFT_1916454 [Mycena galericulata]|nr:hypothetical protein B0H11DRAFT_1916454 [Mycena galericulata]